MSTEPSEATTAENNTDASNLQGSIWHRWDPHIHVPGTVLNDGFTGTDPFEDWLERIENSNPRIRALGITDYLSFELYEKVIIAKKAGRLRDVGLIFPNVEFRFGIGTAKGSALNAHLLVSPESIEHMAELKRFLNGLEYHIGEDTYRCNKEDLIRLGKKHDNTATTDLSSLETGTNQFKVDFNQLVDRINKSDWAKKNVVLAVSGNEDGTAGLQKDPSLSSLRIELERKARVIFSANEKTRNFWLAKGPANLSTLNETWGGMKPCIHGSDAHSSERVGKPDGDRYTWIKGDLTFESLRQICIEPDERVYIGADSPDLGNPTKAIVELSIDNADWIKTPILPLNPGLVAIIGARGSGKTALADLIAVGGFALSSQLNPGSFLKRAEDLLTNEKVTLSWNSGEDTYNEVKHVDIEDIWDTSRIQYLSQQFVEELCSAEGVTDKLMMEMQRVIFQAHDIADRMGASSFDELLEIKSEKARNLRSMSEQTMNEIADALIKEYERRDSEKMLETKVKETAALIEADKKTRTVLTNKGEQERLQEFNTIAQALDEVRKKLDAAKRRHQALLGLQAAADNISKAILHGHFEKLKQDHREAGLSEDQWKNFKLEFSGDVKTILESEIQNAKTTADTIQGTVVNTTGWDNRNSFLTAGQPTAGHSFTILTAESNRLQALIGLDKENTRKLAVLNDKINRNETQLASQQKELALAVAAAAKIKELVGNRRENYHKVFEGIIAEEQELSNLYEPLRKNLEEQSGTLAKLKFTVHRVVDTDRWAEVGERLIDLRIAGSFQGKGRMADIAREDLEAAWLRGDAVEITQSMEKFREKYTSEILKQKPDLQDRAAYREWLKRLGEWMYGTGHISIKYGIQYSGLDIKQLSPGTRGIVLLLLYLSIDQDDDRPLLIDQPEENLDPKSIFDELVPIFRKAKHRRQIIIVTHNANLVVNTDADQVIVATAGEHQIGHLPSLTYQSGGIENPYIRTEICKILEGGEAAFRERAKRLRIQL